MAKRHLSTKLPKQTAADMARGPFKGLGAPQSPADGILAPTPLSKTTARALDDLRAPFTAFCGQFAQLSTSRGQLAPRFMRTFHVWAKETGGTFVDFIREMDGTVPADREGYRAHPSYQAGDYLRRLEANTTRGVGSGGVASTDRPVTPLNVIAMLLATMSPVVDDMAAFYSVFQARLHWTDRMVDRVKALVEEAPPPLLVKQGQERKLHLAA